MVKQKSLEELEKELSQLQKEKEKIEKKREIILKKRALQKEIKILKYGNIYETGSGLKKGIKETSSKIGKGVQDFYKMRAEKEKKLREQYNKMTPEQKKEYDRRHSLLW